MAKVKVASIHDIPEGEVRKVEANGIEIALSHVDGAFHAVQHQCPHKGGPLGEGFLEGGVLNCPWHGWRFDVTTGKSKYYEKIKIKTFPVSVQGEDVFVEV